MTSIKSTAHKFNLIGALKNLFGMIHHVIWEDFYYLNTRHQLIA